MVAVQIISETKLDNSFPAALFKINLVGLSCFYKRRYPFKVTDQWCVYRDFSYWNQSSKEEMTSLLHI